MIDTHCHMDDPRYLAEIDACIARQKEGGVEAILVPGVEESSCETVPALCSRYSDYLFPALGLHPEEVRADYEAVLDRMEQVVFHLSEHFPACPPLVAIGEVGLDYHFSTEFKAEQQQAFRRQIEWALRLDLPLMVHSRDAVEDTLRIIREQDKKSGGRLRGVMHCFSGSRETATEYVKMGWKLGIGGVLTFKNSKLADTLRSIPLEALVLETDAPYMAPVPHRGEVNESRFMVHVVEKLAEVYQIDKNDVISTTNRTSNALFRRK